MATFAYTPNFLRSLSGVERDNYRGKWVIRPIRFNIPSYAQLYHPSDRNRRYQKQVLQDIYFRLGFKWLDNSHHFRPLLKYFVVEKDGDNLVVRPVTSLEEAKGNKVRQEERKYVFRFIESVFVTKKTVRRSAEAVLQQYGLHWYDLLSNSRLVKKELAKNMEKLIVKTVKRLEKEN